MSTSVDTFDSASSTVSIQPEASAPHSTNDMPVIMSSAAPPNPNTIDDISVITSAADTMPMASPEPDATSTVSIQPEPSAANSTATPPYPNTTDDTSVIMSPVDAMPTTSPEPLAIAPDASTDGTPVVTSVPAATPPVTCDTNTTDNITPVSDAMQSTSSAPDATPGCERKPTRPTIIAPPHRPPTSEVEAKGSRKLPLPLSSNFPSTSSPAVRIGGVESRPTIAAQLKKRDLLKEVGLDISDEDEDVFTKNLTKPGPSTILIPPQGGPQQCSHRFVKGKPKGTLCGKRSVKGERLCALHLGASSKKKEKQTNAPSVVVQNDDIKLKLESLEKIVLNLMKNKNETKEKKEKKEPRPRVNIQRIRIYKLNRDEAYVLLRYKDGMPIVKSKGKLYQVKLPSYMSRPIPNGKWTLVCDDTLPRMVWKEV